MRRHEVEETALRSAGLALLVLAYAAALPAALGCALLLGPDGPLALLPALIAPLVAASLLVNAPEAFARAEERRILRESPAVIGMMTMSMQLQPSLERAALAASKDRDGVLAERLREALWASLTRARSSVEGAVMDMTSALSALNDPLRQSFHLVAAATRERSREGMDRLLDKANAIALAGVRDAVDRYVSALSTPTMVLFSLGTLLPIMLFTLLPLLSMGASLGTAAEPVGPGAELGPLLLVVFPMASFLYARSVLQRNPLAAPDEASLAWRPDLAPFLAGWAAAVAAAFLLDLGSAQSYLQAAAVVVPPCAYLARSLRGDHAAASRRSKESKEAVNALFQVGNMMSAGAGMEEALRATARARPGTVFAETMRRSLHRAALSGEGMGAVLTEDGSLRRAAPLVETAYVTVAECSTRDPRYAGQVALNLAQLLADLDACQAKIGEKLKGVVDMMRSTALLFGPVVLGVTSSLLALTGGRTDDIVLLTGVYLAELSLVVSYFTVLLQGEGGWKEVGYQFAVRTPVALAVFSAVSIICRTGFLSLL